MLIFVHIPKTAGTTIKNSLLKHFQKDIYLDYNKPLSDDIKSRAKRAVDYILKYNRKKYACIFGHFQAKKYKFIKNARYCTFLRDPIDSLCSHYFYWQYNPDFSNSMCRKLHTENMSLPEFANLHLQRHFYSFFLKGIKLKSFDYIGIFEYFQESIDLFHDTFGIKIENKVLNKNPVQKNYKEILIKDNIYEEILSAQQENMKIYHEALEIFQINIRRTLDGISKEK